MSQPYFDDLDSLELEEVDRICQQFEQCFDSNHNDIEYYLNTAPKRIQDALFGELLAFELESKGIANEREYALRFPDRQELIRLVFARVFGEQSELKQTQRSLADNQSEVKSDAQESEIPESIGRFHVERVIGKGGFGTVYEAYDQRLKRAVAIKVPRSRFFSQIHDGGNYLAEARAASGLDHPHIVPVFELGSDDSFPLFIVSKLINGSSLAARQVPNHIEDPLAAANLVATVAEALQHAHQQGLVHRDVKPGNILIDEKGQPHLTDFGLALREEDFGNRSCYVGTPTYMSPEQAQGESHRVDGRSDLFSLGVVLYELLVGRRPFRGSTKEDLMGNIVNCRPRPPRQYDSQIPQELERICLKALSKRVSERYLTAIDFAKDLRKFLAPNSDVHSLSSSIGADKTASSISSDRISSVGRVSDLENAAMVPKGLRSFDDHDRPFFMRLLPGPRDHQGLPESIRFWKTRIEETDKEKSFSVGLIYGPSGCGKSSLVKAGLLPQLSSAINSIYIESSGVQTEASLLFHLRKQCDDLPKDLDLKQSLSALRRLKSTSDQKVLIVIDQFEQWLHLNKNLEYSGLPNALRQCDGQHVQCILLVRDDFWLSISRLMQQLDIDLVPGRNIALVDLFDPEHALKVLTEFGKAFGRLPACSQDFSIPQQEFLSRAIDELSQDGKVVCVRLALFAEMLKAKPWLPTTLEVGGPEGIGFDFLNETFSSRSANPSYRFHEQAAQRVLGALLPEIGIDIKGNMQSENELLIVSGYANQPKHFESLIRILDSELRLITPTEDPKNVDSADSSSTSTDPCYQLTHDYLVHSVRDWLTRKQKETMRGRAELRLAERVTLWSSRPEKRQLPSLFELINILAFTTTKSRTERERTMLRKATLTHAILWGCAGALLLLVGISITTYLSDQQKRTDAEKTTLAVGSVQEATGEGIPFAIENLRKLPRALVISKLRDRIEKAEGQQKLSLACALSELGYPEIDAIVAGVINLDTQATEVSNIVSALEFAKTPALRRLKAAAQAKSDARNWRAKTRLAVIAMYLGDLSIAAEMLRSEPKVSSTREMKIESTSPRPWDPIERTIFIAEFPHWHGKIKKLPWILRSTNDASFRSGICLAIGSVARVNRLTKQTLQSVFAEWYQNMPDPGTHSSAGWALRNWGLALPKIEHSSDSHVENSWWKISPQLTMLKIPSGKVDRLNNGFPKGEIVISRPFWISDREISTGLFDQFMKVAEQNERPQDWKGAHPMLGNNTNEHPVQQVSWEDAILFCNWLSKHHGLEVCYVVEPLEPTGKPGEKVKYQDTWKDEATGQTITSDRFTLPQNFKVTLVPGANGFRLPTPEEWEYACRATTTTTYAIGDDQENLPSYAIFANTHTEKCGSLLCNAWGLFDMHGNVKEFCWVSDELTTPDGIRERAQRGGTFYEHAYQCASTGSLAIKSSMRHSGWGFRVARNSTNNLRNK